MKKCFTLDSYLMINNDDMHLRGRLGVIFLLKSTLSTYYVNYGRQQKQINLFLGVINVLSVRLVSIRSIQLNFENILIFVRDKSFFGLIESIQLIISFFYQVEDLPVEDLESRMQVVGDLWEKGILITSEPLEAKYDDP